MQALFTDFRKRLRFLRTEIESISDFDMARFKALLNDESFNDRVILYRIEEYEQAAKFEKNTLLRFLSLWECSLSEGANMHIASADSEEVIGINGIRNEWRGKTQVKKRQAKNKELIV